MIPQLLGLALTSALLNAGQGTASGTLTVQGHTIAMKHAQAVAIEDGTRLVVSDAPIPASALQDHFELMRLTREGKVNAIQIEIGASKTSLGTAIMSNKLEASVSTATMLDPKAIPVFTSTRLEGALSIPASSLGPMNGIQHPVRRRHYPTHYQGRAHPRRHRQRLQSPLRAGLPPSVAAVRAGNKARLLVFLAPCPKVIHQPDFAEKLGFIQAMLPADIQVLKAEESGDSSTLTVTGTEEGKRKEGTVKLTRQAGKWSIERESWTSRS